MPALRLRVLESPKKGRDRGVGDAIVEGAANVAGEGEAGGGADEGVIEVVGESGGGHGELQQEVFES